MDEENLFDVIIIGGSYAGLSSALSLGRSLRKILIIDSGLPCNRQTPHSHNFLTQDGETPSEIAKIAKLQVEQYTTVNFHKGLAIQGEKIDGQFAITTSQGKTFNGKKLILATGIKDTMPEIKGFSECWGISVIHCPYCHGYEFRKGKTGILANGERAFHMASLINNLTSELSIFTSGKADFTDEQFQKLQKNNIKIIEKKIIEIEHEAGNLKNLILEDNEKINFTALYAAIPFTQQCDIPLTLGCEFTENGYLKVDEKQKTTIPGVFACGDNTLMMRSVANAVATGNFAGAMVNMELINETF